MDIKRESELRQATVMFADISGFTAMSEKMPPEEVTDIMNNCFRMMGECVECHGGHIDKFIGDCVMVVFGVPKAIENAPSASLTTALEMREKIYCFNREKNLAIPLDLHIGINSGTVLAGTVGSEQKQEYTVMGDTVNLASRLEDASESGQILVGPETWKLTRDYFDFRSLKPVTLKGKSEPVPVYELISEKSVRRKTKKGPESTSESGGRMIESPLVGRGKEMNTLKLQVMKVINGEGGIVTITGEAGIGKSRLMAELKTKEAMRQVTLLEGRAISMGRNLSFHPIVDLLKGWAGIEEDDTDSGSMAKLENSVRAVHPEEADEIIPFVATMMGMKLRGGHAERAGGIEGEALEKLIFRSVRELLIRGSETRPMVIHIEDLHWADASTMEILEPLLRLTGQYSILFILVYRPGYRDTGDRLETTVRENHSTRNTEIVLSPLESGDSETLIANLLNIQGLPHSLREEIVVRAGGNPFFIEEVVRSLIDEGAIEMKNGSFAVTDRIHHVRIPATINEVLMARIDRLDGETKDLVKTASVIGRNFFHKILTEVAVNIHDIDMRLSYLKDVQLIRDRTRMDELEYLFKHALAQETAYGSLLIQRRKELHGRVALAIETIFRERLHEFYGMLAWHYSQAEDMEKAEEYMMKAGDEAMKASASSEALNYYKDALSIFLNKMGDKADQEKIKKIEINIALSLFHKGQYSLAVEYFDRILSHYNLTLPRHSVLRAYHFTSTFLDLITALYFPFLKFKKTPPRPDLKLLELHHHKLEACAIFDTDKMFFDSFNPRTWISNFKPEMVENSIGIFSQISVLFSYTGFSEKISFKVLRVAKKLLPSAGPVERISYMLTSNMHNTLYGKWENIIDNEDLLSDNIKKGNLLPVMYSLLWLFWVYIQYGDQQKAGSVISKVKTIADEFDHEISSVFHIMCNSIINYKWNNVRGLSESIDYGMIISEKANAHLATVLLLSERIQLLILNGNTETALEALKDLEFLKTKIRFIPFINSYYLISKMIIYCSKMDKSNLPRKSKKKLFKDAIKTARSAKKNSMKDYINRTETLRLVGTCHWLTGRPGRALKSWKESIECGERLNARLELSRTYLETGKRCSVPLRGSGRAAGISPETVKRKIGLTPAECLDRAETLFGEMGLERDLEELRAVRAHIAESKK